MTIRKELAKLSDKDIPNFPKKLARVLKGLRSKEITRMKKEVYRKNLKLEKMKNEDKNSGDAANDVLNDENSKFKPSWLIDIFKHI